MENRRPPGHAADVSFERAPHWAVRKTPREHAAASEEDLLSAWVRFRLARTLEQLGGITPVEPIRSAEALAKIWKVQPRFSRLLHEIVRMLQAERLESHEQDLNAWRDASERSPAITMWIHLVEQCCPQLLNVMSGNTAATDILFSASARESVEAIYRAWPPAVDLNRAISDSIRKLIESRPGVVRILEVGAGTGATADVVLENLASAGITVDYLYTDVSPGFVQRASQRYSGNYPWVRCQALDLERDFASQGLPSQQFDVVIAAHVVHATTEIEQTLTRLRDVLKPGGRLILTETIARLDYMTATFGLLEGWWRFNDEAIRLSGLPMLSASSWTALLNATGFDIATSAPTGNCPLVLFAATKPTASPARPSYAEARDIVAAALGISPSEIVSNRPFREYGIDSSSLRGGSGT